MPTSIPAKKTDTIFCFYLLIDGHYVCCKIHVQPREEGFGRCDVVYCVCCPCTLVSSAVLAAIAEYLNKKLGVGMWMWTMNLPREIDSHSVGDDCVTKRDEIMSKLDAPASLAALRQQLEDARTLKHTKKRDIILRRIINDLQSLKKTIVARNGEDSDRQSTNRHDEVGEDEYGIDDEEGNGDGEVEYREGRNEVKTLLKEAVFEFHGGIFERHIRLGIEKLCKSDKQRPKLRSTVLIEYRQNQSGELEGRLRETAVDDAGRQKKARYSWYMSSACALAIVRSRDAKYSHTNVQQEEDNLIRGEKVPHMKRRITDELVERVGAVGIVVDAAFEEQSCRFSGAGRAIPIKFIPEFCSHVADRVVDVQWNRIGDEIPVFFHLAAVSWTFRLNFTDVCEKLSLWHLSSLPIAFYEQFDAAEREYLDAKRKWEQMPQSEQAEAEKMKEEAEKKLDQGMHIPFKTLRLTDGNTRRSNPRQVGQPHRSMEEFRVNSSEHMIPNHGSEDEFTTQIHQNTDNGNMGNVNSQHQYSPGTTPAPLSEPTVTRRGSPMPAEGTPNTQLDFQGEVVYNGQTNLMVEQSFAPPSSYDTGYASDVTNSPTRKRKRPDTTQHGLGGYQNAYSMELDDEARDCTPLAQIAVNHATSICGHESVSDNPGRECSATGSHRTIDATYQPKLSGCTAVTREHVCPTSPPRPSGGATLAPQVSQPLTGQEIINSANQRAEHPPVVSPDSFISAPLHSLPYQDPSQDLPIYGPDYSSTTDFLNVNSCQNDGLTSTTCLNATECDNARLTTPSQRIESTIRSRNIRSTPPIPRKQQSEKLKYTNYQADEQLARNAQEQTNHHIHCGISQSGQGTSSSLRRRNEDVQEYFFSCQGLLLSPFQPQILFASENMFRTTDIYFTNLCENMSFDADGTILNQNGIRSTNELCNDFDSYCFTATMLFRRNQHIEFGQALSKAFALVKQILQAQHPRTLTCFLEVFIHLIQIGLPDVANALRRFIKNMAAEIIGNGQPWGQICRLLAELDSESLDECMAQLWNRIADTFENELGPSSRLALSVRLDYIKRVYGVSNKLEEERLLRDLLGRFYDIPNQSTPRMMLNLAHNLNRQELHADAETLARRVLSLLEEHEMYVERIAERIECLKVVSHSQFCAGNIAAEETLREAIQMIVHHWGIHHSWALEFKTVLWTWLKDWSREEEANELFEEIEVLRKDEQLGGA